MKRSLTYGYPQDAALRQLHDPVNALLGTVVARVPRDVTGFLVEDDVLVVVWDPVFTLTHDSVQEI